MIPLITCAKFVVPLRDIVTSMMSWKPALNKREGGETRAEQCIDDDLAGERWVYSSRSNKYVAVIRRIVDIPHRFRKCQGQTEEP